MTEKSPLDEFIERQNKEMEYFNAGCSPDFDNPTRQISVAVAQRFLEDAVRLAVQNHAEAVIPERIDDAMTQYDAYRNHVISGIKSESDKWRGR